MIWKVLNWGCIYGMEGFVCEADEGGIEWRYESVRMGIL